MDNVIIGILSVIGLLTLLAFGVHIAIDFFLVGLVTTAILVGLNAALSLVGQTLYYSMAVPSYAALPLFVMMGAFAAKGGFGKSVYDGMYKATLGFPGSLGISTCFGCAAFGAISGSSLATTVIMGKLAFPEMLKHKYKKSFALGIIASAGTFASMIPPSGMFIVYAIFTDQSVGKLFFAGIIPGIITALVYSLSIIFRVRMNPELAPYIRPKERITINSRLLSMVQTWPIVLLATIVLGGIYTGIFTPTEAGAAGAFGTLILGILKGQLGKISVLKEALRESVQTTSMVIIILVGALFYTRVLAMTRIPNALTGLILNSDLPSIVVLIGIAFLYFFLGMIMTASGIYALTLPIIFPIVVKLGYDPIWFGVITLKLLEIGAVTPPLGLNVYGLKGAVGESISIKEVFRGIWPFVICDIIVLVLLIIFPALSLFLPNMMLGK